MLDKLFPQYHIKENYRPSWLVSPNGTVMELDFYIEELKVAFEIQGAQHFSFIPFFHKDYSDFQKRKLYDAEKKNLCYGAGINLVEICSTRDAELEIGKLKPIVNEVYQKKYQESIEAQDDLVGTFYLKKKRRMEWAVAASRAAKSKIATEYNISLDDVEQLFKWRQKAISWFKQGRGSASDWIPKNISPEIVSKIQGNLKNAKTYDDICKAFYLLPVNPLPKY